MKIFVSYTSSDKEWAQWIGWQLQQAGHEPFVHDWEIGAGENIAGWMEQRFKQADRLIGVFSDRYCEAAFSQSERWAAYWRDPRGRTGFFIPIEVRQVTAWPVIVDPLKRLSLVDLTESEASTRLIAFLEPAQSPIKKPAFPSHSSTEPSSVASFAEGGEPIGPTPPSFPAAPLLKKDSSNLLAGVAPPSFDPNLGIRCIDDHEPKPQIFGRGEEIETIVSALLHRRIILVAGGPGMGKTAVTTAAFYDRRIVSHFGRRRVFASLEAATEPRAILAKLVEALGLSPTGDEASLFRILEANAAERPIAAILDNAETVFEIDRAAAERLLSLLAQIRNLALAVSIRGVAPPIPGAAQIEDLSKLDLDAARDTFLTVAGYSFANDPDLPHLLIALDGHALSIRLIAAQAIGSASLKGLRESWDEVHAEILRMSGEDESRLTSVRASLALSLNSKRMKSTPLARRLMALLALLPGGLAETGVTLLLGERGVVTKSRANEAVVCLRQLCLVEHRPDLRLRMLTPLRESVKTEIPLLRDDQNRLIERYLTIAERGFSIGRREWEKFRDEVELEADNLNPICELTAATNINHRHLEDALRGIIEFHVLSGHGSIGCIEHIANRAVRPPSRIEACCIEGLGRVARFRSDYKLARVKLEHALELYRTNGDLQGKARCTFSLADMARIQSNADLAQRQFETARVLFQRAGDVVGQANCVKGLGELAFDHSDLKTGRALIEEALALYRRIGGTLGEGVCIKDLGFIERALGNFDLARSHFQKSLALNRRIGSVIGEANCIKGLACAARSSFDFETERTHYKIALELDRSIGNVTGEAGSIADLGNIARILSEDDAALTLLKEALALYRNTLDLTGEAETMIRLGQTQQKIAGARDGLINVETGFSQYFRVRDSKDRALPGWRAMHQAMTCVDATERHKYRELARSLWTDIGRLDFVTDWIDLE